MKNKYIESYGTEYPCRKKYAISSVYYIVVDFIAPRTGTVIESTSSAYKFGDYGTTWTESAYVKI